MISNFNLEDISQISIGAFALAVPVSFSEEAWKLGESLPSINLFFIFTISITFLAFYAYQSVFQGKIQNRISDFVIRIIIAYFITGCIVALVLFSIDKFPLVSEPLVAIKRLIVISMPASMGAIAVDGLDKE
ncbi:MAG: DUF2391 family protein [Proteobacteria bacterium]|nr:DUF2391 family protein [Pseudomonadota bacterium]MBU1687111.1 DUF2391 family protein [Pseudomonadota bacterium]